MSGSASGEACLNVSAASSSDAPESGRLSDADVIAVVVVKGASPTARRTIKSVLQQELLPGSLVIADASAEPNAAAVIAELDVPSGVNVLGIDVPRARNFGTAVRAALREGSGELPAAEWLWLLHADSAPLPDALAQLVGTVEGSSSIAVVGAKQVMWNATDRIIEAGYTVSPAGRRHTEVELGEIDQGQHDGREDVLAVGLAGALVRRSVWDELRGPDAVLGPFRDSLEFCVRVRRAGHRVVVAPTAIVEHAQLSLHAAHDPAAVATGSVESSFGPRLRAWLYVRTVHAPPVLWWLLPVWYFLCALPRALWRITVKQPRQAVDEVVAPFWLVARVPRVMLARYSLAKTAKVPRRAIRPLLATSRQIVVADRDQRLARAAVRQRLRRGDELQWAAHVRRVRKQRLAMLVALLGLVAVTVYSLQSVIRTIQTGRYLIGGAMLPAPGGWSEWWQAVSSGWNTQSMGASAPVDPLVTGLAPAIAVGGGRLTVAVALLFCLSLAVGGIGAWYAAGAITRSVPVRLWVVLAWTAAPTLFAALGDGRLGAVLVHATLPWFALSLAHAVGFVRRDQDDIDPEGAAVGTGRGSLVAVGAAGLFMALLAAAAPVLLIPLTIIVVATGMAARRRGTTSRGGWWLIPLPAFALLAPLLVRAVVTWSYEGWRIVIADPGGPLPTGETEWWQRALGFAAGGPTGETWLRPAHVAAIAAGVVLIAIALGGLARQGTLGAIARVGWLVAALGFAIASVSAATVVTIAGTQAVTGWPGTGISLAILGLVIAAAAGLTGLGRAAAKYPFGWRQVAVALIAVACAAPLVAHTGAQARGLHKHGDVHSAERAELPAIAEVMQRSDRQVRVLALSGTPNRVSYRILRGDSSTLTQSSAVVAVDRLRATVGPLDSAVGVLAGSFGADVTADLTRYGIGAVVLDRATGRSAALADRIDSAVGMQRVTQTKRNLTWRVVNTVDGESDVAWARIVEGTDGPTLAPIASEDLVVSTTIPAGAANRTIVVAERAAPGWQARVDGAPLRHIDRGDGLLGFELGSVGGKLSISYERASRAPWLALQGGVFLVFALLALPVRRRSGGSR